MPVIRSPDGVRCTRSRSCANSSHARAVTRSIGALEDCEDARDRFVPRLGVGARTRQLELDRTLGRDEIPLEIRNDASGRLHPPELEERNGPPGFDVLVARLERPLEVLERESGAPEVERQSPALPRLARRVGVAIVPGSKPATRTRDPCVFDPTYPDALRKGRARAERGDRGRERARPAALEGHTHAFERPPPVRLPRRIEEDRVHHAQLAASNSRRDARERSSSRVTSKASARPTRFQSAVARACSGWIRPISATVPDTRIVLATRARPSAYQSGGRSLERARSSRRA